MPKWQEKFYPVHPALNLRHFTDFRQKKRRPSSVKKMVFFISCSGGRIRGGKEDIGHADESQVKFSLSNISYLRCPLILD